MAVNHPPSRLIICTAGHVDHGKTALVKALTGIDCDTHPEEKRRGITLALGFAHLDLPGLPSPVGVIDVPGHADLIRTMVSGLAGVDLALVTIAADEGIMPQTREHLLILGALGVRQIVVALTKTDRVDPDTITLRLDDIYTSSLPGLSSVHVYPVSVKDDNSLVALKEGLASVLTNLPGRPVKGAFRLYPDRVFPVKGYGTVAAGTVISGSYARNSPLILYPGEREIRVRRIERYGNPATNIFAGDRAALNLPELGPDDLVGGCVLSDRILTPTQRADVVFNVFEGSRPMNRKGWGVFLCNTNRTLCRWHLLEADTMHPGDGGLAQLSLQTPVFCLVGDRFIVRDTAESATLGGGVVLDTSPLHHRKRRPIPIGWVRETLSGDAYARLLHSVRKRHEPVPVDSLAGELGLSGQEMIGLATAPDCEDIEVVAKDGLSWLVVMAFVRQLRHAVEQRLSTKKQDSSADGWAVRDLLGRPVTDLWAGPVVSLVMQPLLEKGLVINRGDRWFPVADPAKTCPYSAKIGSIIAESGFRGITSPELENVSGLSRIETNRLLRDLRESGVVTIIGGIWFSSDILEQARETLVGMLRELPGGVTLGAYRDRLITNRRSATVLLEYFDKTGLTVRRGDLRFQRR